MRISTNQIYDSGALGIQQGQSNLFKLQNQMSTGRRVLTPQDDPVAAAQALVTTQSMQINQQYIRNQGQATHQMALIDSHLGSVVNLLNNVRERVIQAGNATLTQSDRGAVAAEVEECLQELIGIANGDNGVGEYLFSGFRGNVKPFAVDTSRAAEYPATTPPMAYSGDDGERLLQVSSSRQMGVSVAGSDVFMLPKQGNGTFVNAPGGSVGVAARGATATATGSIVDQTKWNTAVADANAHLPLRLQFVDDAGTLSYQIVDAANNATPPAAYTSGMSIDVINSGGVDFGARITLAGSPAPVIGQSFTFQANTAQTPPTLQLTPQQPVPPATAAVADGGTILHRAHYEDALADHADRLPLEIRFQDNAGAVNYQLIDAAGNATTLAALPAGGIIPLDVGGVNFHAQVKISGTPVPGDSFRINPGINRGSAVMDAGSVLDPQKWGQAINSAAAGRPLEVRFVEEGGTLKYGIYDQVGGLSALMPYASGMAIPLKSANGVDFGAQVVVTGKPAAGDTFTVKASSSQSMFQTLQNLLGVLKSPVGLSTYTNTQYISELNAELNNIDQALQNVSRVQSDIGVRRQEIDALKNTMTDLDVQYQANLSDLQDLDYAQAISDFIKQQTNLEAAQKSFAQISGLSLFKYL